MENLSTSELEGLANLPSVSFMLDMRLDKTDEKSIFSNLLSPISLMIASEQFKHWKPGLSQHTIFECTVDKGDNLQFVITFKIVYAPYQYNIIKEMAIARLSEVLSNISSWSHRIRDGAHMILVVYSSDEIMITRNVNDN